MEAEDFVQRLFEKLLRYAGEIRDPEGLLKVTARTLLIDAYKHAKARPRDLSWEQLVGPDGSGLDHIPQFQVYDFEDATFAAGFDRAVRDLDPEPRDAFIVGELRGLPSREAGLVLGVSRTTANARREAATTEIRKELV